VPVPTSRTIHRSGSIDAIDGIGRFREARAGKSIRIVGLLASARPGVPRNAKRGRKVNDTVNDRDESRMAMTKATMTAMTMVRRWYLGACVRRNMRARAHGR